MKKATVIGTDERGRSSIVKVGAVARENNRGVWVWDPRNPMETPNSAEWFPFRSRRLRTHLEDVK